MARMSIDDKFLRDPRVKAMAAQLGVHHRHMRGWLLEVFAVCYDLETDILTPTMIDQAADHPGFADALFAHDLATTTRHGLRIRGAKKRIRYLSDKAEAGRSGGVKSGESRRNAAEAKRRSKREANGNPLPLVPDLPLPLVPEIPETAPARAIPVPQPVLPAARERAEIKRRLIGRAWTLGGEAFARVQASGIDPSAPNGWAGLPDASAPPMQNLIAILEGLLVGERPDAAAVEAKIANRIAVAEAEARAMSPPSAKYLTPARIWNRESFSIAVDMSPEQVVRRGPARSARRAEHPELADQLAKIARLEAEDARKGTA